MIKKVIFSLLFSSIFVLTFAPSVSAQPFFGECGTLNCQDGFGEQPTYENQDYCRCAKMVGNQAPGTDDIFGTIEPPAGVEKYDAASGGKSGLILFLSNIIRIGTVVAGIWVMVNFILAGWTYITSSGDAKAHGEASNKMTYSLIGIAIIVGAYTLAAVIGLVIFGDAGYILNPQFTGVGGV
jgi:hypothetical protein